MSLSSSFALIPQSRRHRLVWLLGLGMLALAVGCAEMRSTATLPVEQIIRGAAPSAGEATFLPPLLGTPKDESLPPPKESGTVAATRLGFSATDAAKVVPINLDTVLRLAESQNGQAGVGREKLREALANQDVAAKAWLPDLWVGAGWYRHDGGVADEEGRLVHSSYSSLFAGLEITSRFDLREAVYKKVEAERRVWQQRAEVARLSTDALMEASTTYIDLLAARAAEAMAVQVEGHLQALLKQTTVLAKTLPSAEVEVSRIQADVHGQQLLIRKFRESALASTAKLIYLLGLDPASELALMDRHLLAFSLVNVDVSVEELAAQALQNGPGIRELEGLLNLIQQASDKANGLSQYLPVLDLRVAEGGFGTGPGDRNDWDNRFDFGFQLRWNVTEWLTRRERQRVAQARIGQAHATYQDLRAKLTMGVQEAREAVLSGRDQMDLGEKQVKDATKAYERTTYRFNQAPNPKDRSPAEVLLSIRALNGSNFAYVQAIRDHDKAQLRLAILTGMIGSRCEN
jgi:outer membrane protein TolC